MQIQKYKKLNINGVSSILKFNRKYLNNTKRFLRSYVYGN